MTTGMQSDESPWHELLQPCPAACCWLSPATIQAACGQVRLPVWCCSQEDMLSYTLSEYVLSADCSLHNMACRCQTCLQVCWFQGYTAGL